jgi:IPT/TIG domain
MRQTSRVTTFVLTSMLSSLSALNAAGVTIYSTVVKTSASEITITGANFSPSGLAPKVVFATTTLALVSFTSHSAVAKLPTGFAAGSYSLIVTNSNSQGGTFSVTLGAVGPVGPQGPGGPQGATGPQGAAGPGTNSTGWSPMPTRAARYTRSIDLTLGMVRPPRTILPRGKLARFPDWVATPFLLMVASTRFRHQTQAAMGLMVACPCRLQER